LRLTFAARRLHIATIVTV